ncbi:rhodanese-like domain-containing protein [Blastopirellula marina]|uniref:Rhodanese domain-containing protein n=1 Tax=Blastopirellula marina TaxID=124 RepID=A0A2S8GK84_9BACT|nr:rhodanese-like domain-containing protein [Blastopirellula marina]PQO44444.1 hypothetical protein C5Y93_18695 [Blastopirellula marina]
MIHPRTLLMLGLLGMFCLASSTFAVDLRKLKKEIEEEKAVLLDVRERVQWKKAHLVESVSCPFSTFSMDVQARKFIAPYMADPNLKVYCFSQDGKVAVVASDMFNKVGAEVIAIKDHYQAFLNAGFTEKKGTDPDYDPNIPLTAP